ncbi:dephospho-CoA kinase [Chitinispirillales bacterium ANBcel5]|uniref:dephospho-CoA kinase n=1 Tax=Cellulosispirillum alkaliphilum TaxID=3039283 RepID=UPI002A550BFF|nr:dephospho-CoA kinase [Chitinispirillales bacterium ANBcel5]
MKIGIAGYSGSGKTSAASYLCDTIDCELIDGDVEAKVIMNSNDSIKRKIKASFGPACVINNTIDFKTLSDQVFRSVSELRALNSIVHPQLIAHLKERIEQSKCKNVILDAALIPLWNAERWFDQCVWISASKDVRLERLKKKIPTLPEGMIINRLTIQESLFSPTSDELWTVIENNSYFGYLKKRLDEFYRSVIKSDKVRYNK